jgi:hypothetical protein
MQPEPQVAQAWERLGPGGADAWLTRRGATPRVRAALRRLATLDDLRTVDLLGQGRRLGLGSMLTHLLLVRGDWVGLEPFTDGVPLGPLAAVPVYSSDAFDRWVGKAHGPGCPHHQDLQGDDDRLTLEGWIERLNAVADQPRWPGDSPWCGKCGGFAIRRLTADEWDYWRAGGEVHQAATVIARHERYPAGAPWLLEPPGRRDWQQAADDLDQAGAVLDTRAGIGELAGYVNELQARREPLARRTRMRL